jgi:hypothetical protein
VVWLEECTIPKPPDFPPSRTFRHSFFGEIETEESKIATIKWQEYIRGYGEGLEVGKLASNIMSKSSALRD